MVPIEHATNARSLTVLCLKGDEAGIKRLLRCRSHQVLDVSIEAGSPQGRWQLPSPDHVLGDGSRSQLGAHLGELVANLRGSPVHVRGRHRSNESANLGGEPRTAGAYAPALLGPEALEPCLLPANPGGKLDEREAVPPSAPPP